MIALNEATLDNHVRQAVGQLVQDADQLRSLADLLEELGATQGNAAPVDLRRAVTCVQAVAMQVLVAACTAVGAGDRLRVIANIREEADA